MSLNDLMIDDCSCCSVLNLDISSLQFAKFSSCPFPISSFGRILIPIFAPIVMNAEILILFVIQIVIDRCRRVSFHTEHKVIFFLFCLCLRLDFKQYC